MEMEKIGENWSVLIKCNRFEQVHMRVVAIGEPKMQAVKASRRVNKQQ